MSRVLLAEDDAPLRAALREALSWQGFEVYEAADTSEAGRHLDETSFDVVIADIDMPGDGHSLLDRVRSTHPETPVILMTGIEEDGGRSRAHTEGAFDYLVKPINLSLLKTTIERACGQPRP